VRISEETIYRAQQALTKKFPLTFWTPHAGQRPFHASTVKIRYFSGGNQSGKTTSGIADVQSYALGYRPWLPKDHPDFKIDVPVPNQGRVLCLDYKTSLKETIIPKLMEMAPEGFWDFKNDGQGNPVLWKGKNGSVVHVLSYQSDPRKCESGTYHWAFFDEPPPKWAYTATLRGLIKHQGNLWIAGTAVVEPWVFEEIYKKAKTVWISGSIAEERSDGDSNIEVFIVDIRDNTVEKGGGLAASEVQIFEDSLSEKELAVRARGLFPQIGGRLVPHWKDRSPFVVEPFMVNHNGWGLYCGIDPHPRKPTCVEWIWLSPDNHAWSVGELYQKDLNTIPLMCEAILEFEAGFGMNSVRRFMDGRMGKQTDQSSGLTILEYYASKGVYALPTTIPPEVRLLQVKEWSRPVHGVPQWQIFQYCNRLREELSMAKWEDWTARTAHSKPDKETIDKRWDDAITCAGMIFGNRPTGLSPLGALKHGERPPRDRGDGAHTGY